MYRRFVWAVLGVLGALSAFAPPALLFMVGRGGEDFFCWGFRFIFIWSVMLLDMGRCGGVRVRCEEYELVLDGCCGCLP